MPFDRNGVWRLPTEEDYSEYHRQILSTTAEIAPTQEMIKAIADATGAVSESEQVSTSDVYDTIGKLRGAVDIVIPVYGGLHVLRPCIESILKNTLWDYRLIIVDDCSPDPAITEYLEELEREHPDFERCTIAHNIRNRGFAATVNRGVALGRNPYICILNSDTLVTKGWIARQLMALEDDPRNAIVNPATNNTALVNVAMYNGQSYLDMAAAVSHAPGVPTYNEIMPTGFCFTLRRDLWAAIGPFDEAYVRGYGEESDLWFKALKLCDGEGTLLRYRGVVADHAYIFHQRGTSFEQLESGEHMGLRRAGSARFRQLHPDFVSWQQGFDAEGSVSHLRHDLPKAAFNRKYKGHLAWVVKSAGPCGGMNFIADLVNELIEQGYDAKVCVVPDNYDETNPESLSVLGSLRTSPILFKTHDEFVSTFTQKVFPRGKVFAAVTELTPLVWDLHKIHKGIEGFNHVQSYDVELAEILEMPEAAEAFLESYKRLPNIVSSNWVAKTLREQGCDVQGVLLPGVNADLFHPRNREDGDERLTVAVLVNDQYPFKGGDWAREFIRALAPEKHPNMRVLAIGPEALPELRAVTCLGALPQAKMANLLGTEVDILVDPAQVHSYGLPALEALYSGCFAVTRENKGIWEYGEPWDEYVYVEESPAVAARNIHGWTIPKVRREPLKMDSTDRRHCVQAFIDFLYPPEAAFSGHKITVVTPHMRKHGGPTTLIDLAHQLKHLRHEVDMSMIYTDWNPEVLEMTHGLKVGARWDKVNEDIEMVIINSDNPFAIQIMEKYPDKKYVMMKLSHNPRFKKIENNNLDLPWAHIMTSTEWLRQACLVPQETGGWTHQAWETAAVTTVGWYHYAHDTFNVPPTNRTYGNAEVGFRMGTLIHGHPLKGTGEAMGVIDALKRKFEANFKAVGVGEGKARLPDHMQYVPNASRQDMAHVFKQLDIWYSASHSEGLGRMALEAMSAGVAVVACDTGAEFLVDGENCLLYPVGDQQRGAELVSQLASDQDLFTKIIQAGHVTATSNADPRPYRSKVQQVIEGVLK